MRSFSHALRAFVLAACGLAAAAASATTVLPIDATRAIDEAELIFTGHVIHVVTVPSRDGRFPFTFVSFVVEETLKGAADDSELTLRFHGGDLDQNQETVEVVGMPHFELGDEVVLFVRGNGEAACPLVGWWQGKLDIVQHPATGERLLVDHRGAPIEGVGSQGWRHADVRYDAEAQRFLDPAEGSQLLWQDGVVIEEDAPTKARAATYRGVAADTVLGALRQLVAERAPHKGFTRGAVVRSADPVDVPDSVTFTAVAADE